MKAHRDEPPFEYSQINDHIFVGTNACCTSHFNEELLSRGVTADISLEEERLDEPYGVEIFLWLPTVDHNPPSITQMQTGCDMIHSLIEQDLKVYIHCKNGHGRSPTLTLAYFISRGMSYDEAYDLVHEKRPAIHLEDSQIKALKEFEAREE